MHKLAVEGIVERCKKIISEGDCQITESASTETLENCIVQLESELSATKEKLEAEEVHRLNLLNHVELYAAEMADAKLAGFATAQDLFTSYKAEEKRIRESQEQKPVCVVRMSNPPDGNPKPIPKWIMSELDNVVGVLADGDKLYTMPPIPPELAELQRENAELRKKLEALVAFVRADAVVCGNCGALYWEEPSQCDCMPKQATWKKAIVYHEPMKAKP